MSNYFTRFPKHLINDVNSYGTDVAAKLFVAYTMIDRNRNVEGRSYIIIEDILSYCGYAVTRRKNQAFDDCVAALQLLVDGGMIKLSKPLDDVYAKDCIKVEIVPEVFDCCEGFCKLTASQIDWIGGRSNYHGTLLVIFLYVLSKIHNRSDVDDKNRVPEAFWCSIDNMTADLNYAKKTISDCMKILSSVGGPLTKYTTGIASSNIYVLSGDSANDEIKLTLKLKNCTKK